MVAARGRVHQAQAFAPVVDAVARTVWARTVWAPADCTAEHPDGEHPVVADIGSGTGHYLAGVLDARPGARGIGIDLSKFCAKIGRAHV